MPDALAAGFLRPGYTDNSGERSDGERGNANGDNFTLEVIDAVARAARSLEEQFMARRLQERGVDAQVTVLPGLGHNIMFIPAVFAEVARLLGGP